MTQQGFNQILEGLTLLKRGKVRDIYDMGDMLLMVATDRVSAFDVVMNELIPNKGKYLTRIANFWFRNFFFYDNHVIETNPKYFPDECLPYADILADRAILVQKIVPFPVECIVRGYISGSGWKSYQGNGTICGIKLPPGLVESDKLPEPIFTPSTKAPDGEHDINISFEEMIELVGEDAANKLQSFSLDIYKRGADIAMKKGVIIADTKFEFGKNVMGDIILIDEILTPDSSRYWPLPTYKPGGPQFSFDKQFLRDYLETLDWNKKFPPPPLPDNIIEGVRQKYEQLEKTLLG